MSNYNTTEAQRREFQARLDAYCASQGITPETNQEIYAPDRIRQDDGHGNTVVLVRNEDGSHVISGADNRDRVLADNDRVIDSSKQIKLE